jgi:hypothetical protein
MHLQAARASDTGPAFTHVFVKGEKFVYVRTLSVTAALAQGINGANQLAVTVASVSRLRVKFTESSRNGKVTAVEECDLRTFACNEPGSQFPPRSGTFFWGPLAYGTPPRNIAIGTTWSVSRSYADRAPPVITTYTVKTVTEPDIELGVSEKQADRVTRAGSLRIRGGIVLDSRVESSQAPFRTIEWLRLLSHTAR